MPLLNYTTTVEALKTVSEIQMILAKSGASQILLDYEGGRITAVSFCHAGPGGKVNYRLPADVRAVMKALCRDAPPRFQSEAQAERVAWRILKDWLEAQLALVSTQMASVDQVMLPYAITPDGRTVYEAVLAGRLALTTGEG